MDLTSLLSSSNSEYEKYLKNVLYNKPTLKEAIEISKKLGVSLHPEYIFYFTELSPQRGIDVFNDLQTLYFDSKFNEFCFCIKTTHKKDFEILGVEHIWVEQIDGIDTIGFERESFFAFLTNCNCFDWMKLEMSVEEVSVDISHFLKYFKKLEELCRNNLSKTMLEIINMNSLIEIRDKGGAYIGARMGRPEKAKLRKLDGRPQGLFMIGNGKTVQIERRFGDDENSSDVIQNRMRNIIEAYEGGGVESEFRLFECTKCGEECIYRTCIYCGGETKSQYFNRYTGAKVSEDDELAVEYKRMNLELKPYVDKVRERLKLTQLPKLVKGIKGTANEHKTIEVLDKAFLREKYDLYVNKDGTIRYDMIEMGLTHFKAKEIGTSIEKLKELGYTHDYNGDELVDTEQIIEIFPQDVILPDCDEGFEEKASDIMIQIGQFIDELLEKVYLQEPFYNFKTKEDTIGHLLIGLAPHTSAGIVGRIIGYSKTQGCFSHPVWHAAQRRNLDGDENGVLLLLDGLLNGSREFLPNRRGSKTMDVSLVLTSHLYLDQIDDEVHGMDIVPFYPLEFYRACKEYAPPKSIKIEHVESRIGVGVDDLDKEYLGYKFTHDNFDLNDTILCSSYKTLPSMAEKLAGQLEIGRKIRAVDENKVGELVIDKHFMKDIKGNLRKFGMQSFRCTSCNTIFRRPPLNGRCTNCYSTSINFTIHEGSIKKYLQPSFEITKKFKIDPYLVESLELVNLRMEGVFGKDLEKQKNLAGFFGK
ncbi:MAG: hypothetical protein LAT82_05190 [Nanoarchaeota archaeon]|nr:hypothetical protein [Nanoarchaeota archaeon]